MKQTVLTVGMTPEVEGDPLLEVVVPVMLGDQMRAELELAKRKQNPEDHRINFLAAMAWSAQARQGQTTLGFDQWVTQVVEIEAEPEDDAEDVDPTRPGASDDFVSLSRLPFPEQLPTSGGSVE